MKTRIGLVQMSMEKSISANLRKAASMAEEAAEKGAKIICLPELYKSPYFPQDKKKDVKKYLESQKGESFRAFSKIAKEKNAVIIVPIFEISGKKQYNTALMIGENGKLLAAYRKMHIPHDPKFYEKNYFEEGNRSYKVIKTKYGKIATLICFDQWFPEAARINALNGAEILFYPTAIGSFAGRHSPEDMHDGWETVQRAHAIANGVYVAVANRVGKERGLIFWGQSFVCDSFGKIIAKASKNKEEVLIADLDLSYNKFIQEGWGFIRNRRPDSYKRLLKK